MIEYKYMNKAYRDKIAKLDPIAYQRFCNGESITSIAKALGLNRNKLTRRLKEKYAIQACTDGGKKKINSLYFSTLNSESAYWLGLILADGSISSDLKRFELTLKDKEHIESFKTCLQSEHCISTKNVHGGTYYRISFHDQQIVSDLVRHGILPNKSNIDFHLPDIPDSLFGDFLRGIIDGDGMYYASKTNAARFHIYISAGFSCPTYAQELCDRIASLYHVNVKLQKQRTCYRITLFKRDSVKIVKQIYYDNCMCLERKRQICVPYL